VSAATLQDRLFFFKKKTVSAVLSSFFIFVVLNVRAHAWGVLVSWTCRTRLPFLVLSLILSCPRGVFCVAGGAVAPSLIASIEASALACNRSQRKKRPSSME
jgi:hypothetical protein